MNADLRRVVRTIKVVGANHLHVRLSFFDQHGSNIGFLTVQPEDLTDLVHRIEPERLVIPMHWPAQPENWKQPENCQVTFTELT